MKYRIIQCSAVQEGNVQCRSGDYYTVQCSCAADLPLREAVVAVLALPYVGLRHELVALLQAQVLVTHLH